MTNQNPKKAIILLADGTIFYGTAIGNNSQSVSGEFCFTTAMTGYEDFFLDPSYSGKIVVSASAHIGGYGVNEKEIRNEQAKLAGLVARNLGNYYSRPAADGSLQEFLERDKVVMIADVDTRALVTHLRTKGNMKGIISTDLHQVDVLKERLKNDSNEPTTESLLRKFASATHEIGADNNGPRIAVLDLGIKKSLLDFLTDRNCSVKVFPFNATFEEIEEFKPQGYFVAGGPGNPMEMTESADVVKSMMASGKPLFAAGTGANVLALANGVSSTRMKIGHHGANQSVKNVISGKGEITTQNHNYVIDKKALAENADLEITHINLNDNSVEGFRVKDSKVFAVQYIPGGNPGPSDSEYLWDQFIDSCKN